jgi:hypothetical protein
MAKRTDKQIVAIQSAGYDEMYKKIIQGEYIGREPFDSYRRDREQYLKYQNEQKKLFENFKSDLRKEFRLSKNRKFDAVFQMAWDKGHSAGYHEVLLEFHELTNLIL